MNKRNREKLMAIGLSEKEIDNLLEMQRKDNEARKEHARRKKRFSSLPYFPVELILTNEDCRIQMNSDEMDFYIEQLSPFGFSGNGHCWAGILEEFLKMNSKIQIANLSIDSNSDSCIVICKNPEKGKEIAKYFYKVFSNKNTLNKLIRRIDKTKIDC